MSRKKKKTLFSYSEPFIIKITEENSKMTTRTTKTAAKKRLFLKVCNPPEQSNVSQNFSSLESRKKLAISPNSHLSMPRAFKSSQSCRATPCPIPPKAPGVSGTSRGIREQGLQLFLWRPFPSFSEASCTHLDTRLFPRPFPNFFE